MEFSEKVLVLQLGRFKEADLWLRLLSPSRGVVSAFAFGGAHSRKRFIGCLDHFNYVFFRMQDQLHKNYLVLHEGILINGPKRLRTDWLRLGLANNCAKFLHAFGITLDGAKKAHTLFLSLLQLLEEVDTLPLLLPQLFRLRLAFEQGYSVTMDECSCCRQALTGSAAYYFKIRAGQLFCRQCIDATEERGLVIHKKSLEWLLTMMNLPINQWSGYNISTQERSECAQLIDGFIHYHVGLVWEGGYFIRH